MSRGLGRIQRRVLELLEAQPDRRAMVLDLVAEIYNTKPATPAQVNAVNRALHGLRKAGKARRFGWREWVLGPEPPLDELVARMGQPIGRWLQARLDKIKE